VVRTSGWFTQLPSWDASDNTKAVYIGQEVANRNLTHGHRGLGIALSSLMLMGLWGGRQTARRIQAKMAQIGR
jgi:hypothetical protein